MLLCVTETLTRRDIDALVEALAELSAHAPHEDEAEAIPDVMESIEIELEGVP